MQRSRIAFAFLVSVLMALGCLSSPAFAATPNRSTAAGEVPVRVGTYNILAGLTPAVFGSAVQALMARVDVAGLQEVNSMDKQRVLDSLGASGWGHFRAARGRGEQNPVIWNQARFRLHSAQAIRVAGATNVGNEMGGKNGGIVKAHFVSVVRLVDSLTGQQISVVNGHLPPGAVKAGERWAGRPLLFERFVEELKAVVAVTRAERAWGQVFVMGDFNVGWVADDKRRKRPLPLRTFERVGMKSMWATERPAKQGTHNDALIDQVYSTGAATRASVEFDITYSDHRPAVAVYALTDLTP